MLTKKTSRNQITIPKSIANKFSDTTYFDVQLTDKYIVLKPVRIDTTGGTLEKVRSKMGKLGITEKDIKEAIAWTRASVK